MSERILYCDCKDHFGRSISKYDCDFCENKINAKECMTPFFVDQNMYEVTTLSELENQVQKLTNEVANLRQHLKLLIMDSK